MAKPDFLSEVGDVDKMADDAARLLTDPNFAARMGKRARESAVSRYRTDIVIPKYIEFYERVLAEPTNEVQRPTSNVQSLG